MLKRKLQEIKRKNVEYVKEKMEMKEQNGMLEQDIKDREWKEKKRD